MDACRTPPLVLSALQSEGSLWRPTALWRLTGPRPFSPWAPPRGRKHSQSLITVTKMYAKDTGGAWPECRAIAHPACVCFVPLPSGDRLQGARRARTVRQMCAEFEDDAFGHAWAPEEKKPSNKKKEEPEEGSPRATPKAKRQGKLKAKASPKSRRAKAKAAAKSAPEEAMATPPRRPSLGGTPSPQLPLSADGTSGAAMSPRKSATAPASSTRATGSPRPEQGVSTPKGPSPKGGSPKARSPKDPSPKAPSPGGPSTKAQLPEEPGPQASSPKGPSPKGPSPKGRGPQARCPKGTGQAARSSGSGKGKGKAPPPSAKKGPKGQAKGSRGLAAQKSLQAAGPLTHGAVKQVVWWAPYTARLPHCRFSSACPAN
jgi:hypothetical protein